VPWRGCSRCVQEPRPEPLCELFLFPAELLPQSRTSGTTPWPSIDGGLDIKGASIAKAKKNAPGAGEPRTAIFSNRFTRARCALLQRRSMLGLPGVAETTFRACSESGGPLALMLALNPHPASIGFHRFP
jgi:hypothetical protein